VEVVVGLSQDISRQFVAVPDSAKGQLLFKWPDHELRRWTRVVVDVDEQALFVSQGRVVGSLPPGRHQLDATELPFLGDLADKLSGGNMYDSELFFVTTRELTDLPFGGPVDSVRDPESTFVVGLRAFGDYAMHVVDASSLILNLVGTVDLTDPASVTHWSAEQVLKALRTTVVGQIASAGWGVLGLAAHSQEIEAAALPAANATLARYGLAVTQLGNVTVTINDEDQESLRTFAKDKAYTSMTGSFAGYAQGEALLGAGTGMSHSGGAGEQSLAIAGLAVGGGIAGSLVAPRPAPAADPTPAAAPTAPAAPAVAAPAAAASAPAPAVTLCQCGQPLPPGAAFCPACGTAVPVVVEHFCVGCGHALEPGAKFCAGCGRAVDSA
jgi:membrane protease subunit (stomatin/prohibitin family)